MPVFKNTYKKLDRDTAFNKVDNESMYDCRNFRITGNDPARNGGLTIIKGNYPLDGDFDSIGATNHRIIGSVRVRDKMILFTTDDDTPSPTASNGKIWETDFADDQIVMADIRLLYSGILNFSMQNPIEDALSFYENEDIVKIYWSDNYNDLRYANVATYLTDDGLIKSGSNSYLDPDEFNIVQKMDLSTPEFMQMVSGSIPVGMVQYGYRLYKLNGPASNFSPLCRMIPLTTSSMSLQNTISFKGADRLNASGANQSSGKGIVIKIENIDTDYDRIEVIAVHYSALNEVPKVYIVEVKPVDSTVYITDDGLYNSGEYLYSEFVMINNPFRCKSIAAKFNILFATGIKQNEFDFDYDARAYRYASTRSCYLYETDGGYWMNSLTYGNTWLKYNSSGVNIDSVDSIDDLPFDIDAICKSNDITFDSQGTNFAFHQDGTTRGGEGPNVSYIFQSVNEKPIDNLGNNKTFGVVPVAVPNYYNGPESPVFNQSIRTLTRGEIYRVGCVGFDDKGRPSPVKWIGDIRTPEHGTDVSGKTGSSYTSLGATNSWPIEIVFTLTNLPTEVKYVQIVYVKRTDDNKTVKLQGNLSWIYPYNGSEWIVGKPSYSSTSAYSGLAAIPKKHLVMFSPEISFYKNFTQSSNDFLQLIGTCTGVNNAYGTQHEALKYHTPVSLALGKWYAVQESRMQNAAVTPDVEAISTSFGDIPNFIPISGWTAPSGVRKLGNLGTSLLIKLGTALDVSGIIAADKYMIANYRTNLYGSQYGGHSYEDRTKNEYIAAGDIVAVSTGNATAYFNQGDTYIAYTDHLTSYYNEWYQKASGIASVDTFASVVMFPCETSVNLAYRLDDCWHRIFDNVPTAYWIREKGNAEFTETISNADGITYLNNWTDLYLENTVYKRTADAKKFLPAPFDYNPEYYNDCLVMASNMKEGRETIDPWTQWLSNESIIVNKTFGPVNKLAAWKNYLLFFQDNAVGSLSVMDRSVISDTEGKSTTLGQGEILQRYDYISTKIGLSTKFSIAESINGIYWYDHKRRTINRFLNNLENISTIRGINSYLNGISDVYSNSDNIMSLNLNNTGFFMVFNPMYNEIWFIIKNHADAGIALIFNEVIDAFTGFADTLAYFYMIYDNKLFSAYSKHLYKEDYGYPGQYFGKYFDSFVEVIVNPMPNIVATFTNFEISSEVYLADLPELVSNINAPSLETEDITTPTSTGCVSGGDIISNGGIPIIAKGVCYGPTADPTIDVNSHTSDGTGSADYASTVTGLLPANTYYVRAYATNSVGTGYGSNKIHKTTIPPVILLTAISNIGEEEATTGWTLVEDGGDSPLTCGLCWSTSPNPTILDDNYTILTGVEGVVEYTITGLTDTTQYYVRAFAINSLSATPVYSDEKSFNTTNLFVPTLTTNAVDQIGISSARSGGVITNDGGAEITEKGLCYSLVDPPTTADDIVTAGTGSDSFSADMEGLTDNTQYYVRAYAINKKGTGYSATSRGFSTLDLDYATVLTTEPTVLSHVSIRAGGNVTHDGNALGGVTQRGIAYGTSTNPTIAGDHIDSGTGEGTFSVDITGLSQGTTYYMRAYAVNSEGVSYGTNWARTTTVYTTASVETNEITVFGSSTATAGGNVLSGNGSTVYERGIYYCIDDYSDPVADGVKVADTGTGLGSFDIALTGLLSGRGYHVMAYAMNSVGTAYGVRKSFTTINVSPPNVSTADVTSIDYTTATCGGTITSDGGDPVTARGVCWKTSSGPTTSDSKTIDGSGIGTFVSSITSLSPGTLYYVRAYATNGAGTSYGDEKIFSSKTQTAPVLSQYNATSITAIGATLSAILLSTGGAAITRFGFCWNTSGSPTVADSYNDCITEFSHIMNSGSDGITYYVRAYAQNSVDITYSNEISFTTIAYYVPTVVTNAYSGLTTVSVVLNGNATSDGGVAITEKGFFFGTDPVAYNNPKYDDGDSGTGSYSVTRSSLTPGETYYAAAYATNSKGDGYGAPITIVMNENVAPTVTTDSITGIGYTEAGANGNVIYAGGSGLTITGRGFCVGTSPDPTVQNYSSGSGIGSFYKLIDNLPNGTTHYIRAYAVNSVALVGYGENLTFTTATPPITGPLTDNAGYEYDTIDVAGRRWIIQNFKGTKFVNGGSIIASALSYNTLQNAIIPYIADFTPITDQLSTYGRYYNGYAAQSANNIAYLTRSGALETGWRVPTIADWMALVAALGGSSLAGGAMKEVGTAHWTSPNTGATNSSGYTALPGGSVFVGYNTFSELGLKGSYWCSDSDMTITFYHSYAAITYEARDIVDCFNIRLCKTL
ncbi:MAG: hypothetical protein UR43_C0015G0020 [candidate division TM6 bacterium GW2011_GWF2_33_332]|nr:MAG: hypothetical protein UR43_C0015G0020 [candidate division TM6 bacterium GW2011_GWF2_33_332]